MVDEKSLKTLSLLAGLFQAGNLGQFVFRHFSDADVFPVDIHEVIRRMDVVLFFDDIKDCVSKTFVDRDGRGSISVNASENVLRQRFAMAHGLGHLLLNHGNKVDTVDCFFTGVKNVEEQAANLFTLNLLVPQDVLQYFIDKRRMSDVRLLAKNFGVTTSLILFAFKHYGWFR